MIYDLFRVRGTHCTTFARTLRVSEGVSVFLSIFLLSRCLLLLLTFSQFDDEEEEESESEE